MKAEDVALKLKYDNKEEEDYMRKKLAEYYSIYPQDSGLQDYHSSVPDFEERCKKITDRYNKYYK